MKRASLPITLLILLSIACSIGGQAVDFAPTETAIAAQVMTQVAVTAAAGVSSPPSEPPPTPTPTAQSPTEAASPVESPAPAATTPGGDFTPCSGYAATTRDGQPQQGYGPWASRLLLAFSDDGLTFTRANQILADQADVPDAITTPDGEVRVYFVILCPEAVRNQIVVAVSRDASEWVYKKVTIGGLADLMPFAVDPTVERMPEGTFRLYFTSSPPAPAGQMPPPRSYSAISTDGYTFELEVGARFAVTDQRVLDPTALVIGDLWHLFAGGAPGSNYHATSPDGLNFTRVDDLVLDGFLFANGLAVEGGYRYYGFIQGRDGSSAIHSVFTTDGQSWNLEPGLRLELDESTGLESVGVKDPGVSRLPDGRYLMVYSTIIPGYPTPAPGGGQPGGAPAAPP